MSGTSSSVPAATPLPVTSTLPDSAPSLREPPVEKALPLSPAQVERADDLAIPKLMKASRGFSRQLATFFLGAVSFAVAMSWNHFVQLLIAAWLPMEQKDAHLTAKKTALYTGIASIILTLIAVLLALGLTRIYGPSIRSGQASAYGMGL